jgi:CysZ protein
MIEAFLLPYRALPQLWQTQLRPFVLLPLLINIVLFSIGIWAAGHYFGGFLDWMVPPDSWWSFLRWLLWPLFALAWGMAVFYGFTITANLIGAPFNGVLSARAEQLLSGHPPPQQPPQGMAAILPTILSETGKLWYLVSRAVPILLLFLVPGINIIALPLWIALGCWFLAIEYGDYPLANHGIEGKAQRSKLAERRLDALAFGAGLTTMMLIPGLNFLAMPAGVVGATRLWNERYQGKVQAPPAR